MESVFFLPYVLALIFGIIMGITGSMNIIVVIVVVFALIWGRNLYISYRTKNMALVEKLLHTYRKRPYEAFLIESLHGSYEQAEKQLAKIKNKQQKSIALTATHIHKNQLDEAKLENQKIKNDDIRHYNSALIALQAGDREGFHLAKNNIKSESTRIILEAEEAYKKGDFNEAERLGIIAIAMSAGVKRYVLVKSLERERKNPRRVTFF